MLIRKLLLPGHDEISNLYRTEKHHLYLHVVIKLTRSFSVVNLKKKKRIANDDHIFHTIFTK